MFHIDFVTENGTVVRTLDKFTTKAEAVEWVETYIQDTFVDTDIWITDINKKSDQLLNEVKEELKMDINNILNKIENYKAATAQKAEQERVAAEHHRQSLLDQIRVMKPDIDNLITVAETVREAGIPLQVPFDCFDSSYESGDFFTDATTHKVGFVSLSFANKAICGVGFEGGGCCGEYDFFTDGSAIYDKNRNNGHDREASTEHLKKFIEKFPEFERAFYDYIEKVTSCIPNRRIKIG